MAWGRKTEVEVRSERNPSNRDAESRSRPFTAVLLTAWLAIPAFVLVLRILIGFGGDPIRWLIVWLCLFLLGAVLPGAAIAYGYKVVKRVPFVIVHVALTIHLFAVAVSLGMLPGWNHVPAGDRWWHRTQAWFADVFVIPLWVVVVYYICSLVVALSWLMYRIDAFRASTGNTATADGTPLGKLLAKLEGVNIRTDAAVIDDVAAEIPIEHEGVPLAQVRQLIPAIEETPGVVRGRSSIIETGRGGHSTMRVVHTDPHGKWRVWPGLSAPGGSFTEPIRTSYYSTGEMQWYSFVKTPKGIRFAQAPDFASTNDSFKGTQGATGSGKSGDAAVEFAEVASRRNVLPIYIDPAKLMQNASWCLDFCALAAGSPATSGALFAALQRVGEYRVKVLGEAGIRNFTDAAAEQTGLSWIYIFADEFDVAKQTAALEWLATKGRSLGFRFSFTLPRAVGDKISTDIRAAVGMWAQFGITQDYDKGFVLSSETIEAGANPESFGVSVPGAHYLDRAPGIPQRMWALDCRTYQTQEDYSDLRRSVERARATFTPPTFTPGELEVLGDVAQYCAPSVVRGGYKGAGTPPPAVRTPAPAVALPAQPNLQDTIPLDQEENDMPVTYDAQVQALLDDAPPTDVSDVEAEFGPLDARDPITGPAADDGIRLSTTKPLCNTPEETVAEFEWALFALLGDRDHVEIGNADVIAIARKDLRSSWLSKRFTALCDGEIAKRKNPPAGLTIERIEGSRGRFNVTRIRM